MININIKIIGSNCSNGMKLKKMVEKAIGEIEGNINVEELNDNSSKNKFNISNVPGLVIDNKLVSQGKVLTVKEIKKVLIAS